jgi:hypothetical protein
MKHSPSWGAGSCSAVEVRHILWNQKFHHHILGPASGGWLQGLVFTSCGQPYYPLTTSVRDLLMTQVQSLTWIVLPPLHENSLCNPKEYMRMWKMSLKLALVIPLHLPICPDTSDNDVCFSKFLLMCNSLFCEELSQQILKEKIVMEKKFA